MIDQEIWIAVGKELDPKDNKIINGFHLKSDKGSNIIVSKNKMAYFCQNQKVINISIKYRNKLANKYTYNICGVGIKINDLPGYILSKGVTPDDSKRICGKTERHIIKLAQPYMIKYVCQQKSEQLLLEIDRQSIIDSEFLKLKNYKYIIDCITQSLNKYNKLQINDSLANAIDKMCVVSYETLEFSSLMDILRDKLISGSSHAISNNIDYEVICDRTIKEYYMTYIAMCNRMIDTWYRYDVRIERVKSTQKPALLSSKNTVENKYENEKLQKLHNEYTKELKYSISVVFNKYQKLLKTYNQKMNELTRMVKGSDLYVVVCDKDIEFHKQNMLDDSIMNTLGNAEIVISHLLAKIEILHRQIKGVNFIIKSIKFVEPHIAKMYINNI